MKKNVWWWIGGGLALFIILVGVDVTMLSPMDGKQGAHFIKKARGSDAWEYLSTINPPKQWTTYYAHKKYSEWVKDQIKEGLPSKLANLSQSEKSSVIEDICRTPAVLSSFDKLATKKIHYHILGEGCRQAKHQQHLAFGDSDYFYLSRKADNICLKVVAYKIVKPTIKKFQNEIVRGYALKYIAQIEDGQKPHIPDYAKWNAAKAKLLEEKRAAKNQLLLGMFAQEIRTQIFQRWVPESSSASSCIIQIRLGAQGQLLGVPIILKSNGDAHFNHLVIAAVEAAAPFVPPTGLPYSAFNQPISLKMNSEDLNQQ